MTRRIAVAFTLMAVLLVAAVIVPLGLLASRQDRATFRDETVAEARRLAASTDGKAPTIPDQGASGRRDGDQVTLLDAAGELLPTAPGTDPGPEPEPDPALVEAALSGRAASEWSHDVLVAAVPGQGWAGALVLTRPAEQLDARLGARWLLLGTVGALAVAGSFGLATVVGRRLARPVTELEHSVISFGAGDLTARAGATSGPPEVRSLAGEFNRTAARLDQLVHSHRALVADVAHQLRTPLAALRLHLELAGQDVEEPAAREEITAALQEVSRLSRLLDGLLAAARAEASSGQRDSVAVLPVVRGRVAFWQPLATERGAVVEAPGHPPGGPPGPAAEGSRVQVGPGHLEQVLDNLVANALDAGAPHVRIEVAASGRRGVTLRVVDDGPGLPAELREVVLDRYAAGRPGGTGLGLAIVHRLVTADGGRLGLAPTPGGGLTVTVELPAAT